MNQEDVGRIGKSSDLLEVQLKPPAARQTQVSWRWLVLHLPLGAEAGLSSRESRAVFLSKECDPAH